MHGSGQDMSGHDSNSEQTRTAAEENKKSCVTHIGHKFERIDQDNCIAPLYGETSVTGL